MLSNEIRNYLKNMSMPPLIFFRQTPFIGNYVWKSEFCEERITPILWLLFANFKSQITFNVFEWPTEIYTTNIFWIFQKWSYGVLLFVRWHDVKSKEIELISLCYGVVETIKVVFQITTSQQILHKKIDLKLN